MSRRGGPGVQLLAVVAVAGLFIYGFYSYHDVRTRLRKTDEKADRLRQQHDSISAQLQVVYEHKTRLEKSLQSEKQDHRKTKEDSLTEKNDMDLKFTKEKQDLLSRINSINQEHKLLESRHADLQAEMAKEQEKYEKLEEDQRQISTQHQQEYNQLKQERENEAAQMRDQISDLTRNNADMQEKLRLALETAANSEAHQLLQQQKQQQSVQQQQQPVQQQHQPVQQQSVQQQQQPVQQPSVQQQAVQQQQQQFMQAQPILQQQQKQQEYAMNQIRQHNLPDVPGQPQVWQQNLGQAPQYQQQEQMKLQQQPQQQPQQVQQQPVGDTDNQGQGKAAEEDEQVMQVPVPGGEEKKAYFEPKEAKPDGLGVRVDGAVEAQDAREEEDVNQQVAAPDLKPDEEEKKKEELLGEDEKEDADRIEPPFGVQGMAAADAQQVDRPQAPQQLEEDAEEVDMIRGAGDPQDEDERQPEKQVFPMADGDSRAAGVALQPVDGERPRRDTVDKIQRRFVRDGEERPRAAAAVDDGGGVLGARGKEKEAVPMRLPPDTQLAGGEKMAVGGDDDGDDYMGDNADDDKVDLADHDDGLDDAAVADGDQQQDHQEQAGGVGL